MRPAFVLVVYLAVPGLLPALVAARRSPAVIFLAPLIGAAMAAVAAEAELGLGGTLLACYLPVVLIVNGAVVAWWLLSGRRRPWWSPPFGWSVLTVLVMAAALAFPLTALRVPLIGWDANSIWLTHSLLLTGGHHALVTGLRNPATFFDNPDYPPLVPAAGALELIYFGADTLHSAVVMTELLTACAVAAVGCLVATCVRRAAVLSRAGALATGGALCLVAYAISDRYAITGYTDLLWAAAAVAAIICGLVLPRDPQFRTLAWIFAVIASLTKNEGLTTALAVLTLIAFRYKPLGRRSGQAPSQGAHARSPAAVRRLARDWPARGLYLLVPAVPGLTSAALARRIGLQNIFFIHYTARETLSYRAAATFTGIAAHLAVAPVALAVLILGACFLRAERIRLGLANPAWLWLAWLSSLAIIFATYVFGSLAIQTWLFSSLNRTTIFAQLLLCAEIAIWMVVTLNSASGAQRHDQPGTDDVLVIGTAMSCGPERRFISSTSSPRPGRGARSLPGRPI